MSVTSNRSILLTNTGDIESSQSFAAEANATASGQNELAILVAGNNTIDVPDDAVAVTILMPADNEVQVTLKGANGDSGIDLNLLDPTSIGLGEGQSDFVLSAADDVTVRLIFS